MRTLTLNFIFVNGRKSKKELKAAATPFFQTSFKPNAPDNPFAKSLKSANIAAAFGLAKSQLLATSPIILREIELFKRIMAIKNTFGEI
ncbi:MAG: hypothetical protein R3A80_06375 [Bdellovibrionota bacterium]